MHRSIEGLHDTIGLRVNVICCYCCRMLCDCCRGFWWKLQFIWWHFHKRELLKTWHTRCIYSLRYIIAWHICHRFSEYFLYEQCVTITSPLMWLFSVSTKLKYAQMMDISSASRQTWDSVSHSTVVSSEGLGVQTPTEHKKFSRTKARKCAVVLLDHCISAIRSCGEWCWKNYRLLINVPPFARGRFCLFIHYAELPIADDVAQQDVRKWIAGKRYIPKQKSPRKGSSVRCPLGDGKSFGVAEHFPWPVAWAQTGYPFVP